ncbi:MAG: hypothetical protein Q9159_006545 [Coniocarpon cinnabarinum]
MSSIRNAVPSRSYRERPQPLSRSRSHPLLEKRKDYRLRAADHKAKQIHLKRLREKAAARNPDEFSFKMMSGTSAVTRAHGSQMRKKEMNQKNEDGQYSSGGGMTKKRNVGNIGGAGQDELQARVRQEVELGGGLSVDTVKLLKTQDAGFLRTARAQVRREKQRLQGAMAGISGSRSTVVVVVAAGAAGSGEGAPIDDLEILGHSGIEERTRTMWIDGAHGHTCSANEDVEKVAGDNTRQVRDSSTRQEMMGSLRSQHAEQASLQDVLSRQALFAKQRTAFDELRAQDEELRKAERELDLQRARMRGDLGGVNKSGVKFKIKNRKH